MDTLFDNDEFAQFMQKVSIKTLPEAVEAFEKEPEKSITLLDVKTRKGATHSKRTQYCKGDPRQPMPHEEILNKFLSQAEGVIGGEKAHRIIDLVGDLENLSDVSEIYEMVH